MSGFKPYPAYRDSGVEWLGEVPEHWEPHKLKHVTTFSGGGTPSRDNLSYWNGDIPWVSPKDMKREMIDSAEEAITAEGLKSSTTSLIPAGRALLVVRSGILKHTIPVAINAVPVALNQDMKALSFNPRALSSQFFLRWVQGLNDNLLKAWLKQGATVESIEHDYLAGTEIPLPPIVEQQVISAFLDHETARIDVLIEEQQCLIELLKEKRQAVISHAVTKGLDPSVPMKDSGVEWLGEVPAHWTVSKLKFMTDCVVDCPHETPAYDPDGAYLVIRTADLDQGVLSPEKMYRLERDEYLNRTRRASLRKNDVVYGREGERWGHAALVPESDLYALGQRMMQFRVSVHVCPEFFMYQLNSVSIYRQGEIDTVGATVPHVNISTIINYQMMIPPLAEQTKIARYLSKTLQDLDSLIGESIDTVDLLQERRSALISAAVTGKIDLRGWQPPASASAPTREQETA